ncbi:MAG: isochorismatase family protein [Armatimonadetes bacterium]|nr:isochorismatase family protein [Armatimonadota bacterium]MDE2205116.1 isochorismatase family protein [Armatimonadota bacterium]
MVTLNRRQRRRVEGEIRAEVETREVSPERLALVLCDVWDQHWCRAAADRVDELAPAVDRVVRCARELGAHIIHAPSDVMGHYEGSVARLRAMEAPKADPPPLRPPAEEPPLPVDVSDGGCESEGATPDWVWSRQHAAIGIEDSDALSDVGDEVYNLLRMWRIETALMMGVHTNMCVLNRSFAIRAMLSRGVDVVLVRDLTDAMYSPSMPPHVNHFEGVNLVVQHIETWLCPSILSTDITGEAAFRFRDDTGGLASR